MSIEDIGNLNFKQISILLEEYEKQRLQKRLRLNKLLKKYKDSFPIIDIMRLDE